MRKFVFLVAVFCLLFSIPSIAGAQSPDIVLGEVIIQIWPEYDKPEALVIYDFSLSPTVLPATVQIRIPKDGELLAVAQDTPQGLMMHPYEFIAGVGEYDLVVMTLTEMGKYRVEFYEPLERSGSQRRYILDWPGDYAVGNMLVFVQKPIGVRNLKTDPVLPELPGPDGFIYAQGQFTNLPAGQVFTLVLEYEKDDDSLSVANLPASISAPLETAQGSTFPLTTALPWLLGGFGAALIVGGLLWFWYSGRGRGNGRPSRKRHAVRAEHGTGDQVYCSQCGKRAEGSDRFCRACGARLRR
jgi:hypothetical protein